MYGTVLDLRKWGRSGLRSEFEKFRTRSSFRARDSFKDSFRDFWRFDEQVIISSPKGVKILPITLATMHKFGSCGFCYTT